MKNDRILKANVLTAFFAAIIFLGIQSFRIPMPAAVGTPFVHFAHIFVVLAILLLGMGRSMIAACLGLLIFDLLNGYAAAIPNVFVSEILLCLVTSLAVKALRGGDETERGANRAVRNAAAGAAVYGVLNVVIDFAWNAAALIITGSSVQAALAAELTSIPATVINSVFTVIGTAILYVPVKKAYNAIGGLK